MDEAGPYWSCRVIHAHCMETIKHKEIEARVLSCREHVLNRETETQAMLGQVRDSGGFVLALARAGLVSL